MKYFGTDGIRGIVDKTLNRKTIFALARSLDRYYKMHRLKPVLLVGNDTRLSSGYILSLVQSILLKHGIELHDVGVCTSPCLAYLTKKFNYPLSLMISASHNPSEYNGLKFFNSNGEKVDNTFEEEIEKFMTKKIKLKTNYKLKTDASKLKKYYINYLKNLKICENFNKKYDFLDKKIDKNKKFKFIFDCANGATTEFAKEIFQKNKIINARPNGENINKNSGCTHIEYLKFICEKTKSNGFAFDGDGDRIFAVTEKGDILGGDEILFILSNHYLSKGDTLVGTIYTNSGLEKQLKKRGINLARAGVGDKLVNALMKKLNSSIGGEDSGHIILKSFLNTGDGMLVAIILMNIMKRTNLSLEELMMGYEKDFQLRSNLAMPSFSMTNELKNLIDNSNARIIIRPSGTEPVLRVFVEHSNRQIAQDTIKKINLLLAKQINK